MTQAIPSINAESAGRPWAVTPAKLDAVAERLVAAASPRLQMSLRGILVSLDLVVTSQARYNERCQIPGTVEFSAHRHGRVLHDDFDGS